LFLFQTKVLLQEERKKKIHRGRNNSVSERKLREELEKKVWDSFSEAIFLKDLAQKLNVEIADVWEVILHMEEEGLVSFYNWQRKTVIYKKGREEPCLKNSN